jgi:hypothetical protein
MAKSMTQASADMPASSEVAPATPAPRVTRSQTLIDMMRTDAGATAAELGAAVGWQVHSVRGFVAGTLRKRSDLTVLAERKDGVTRYRVVDRAEDAA